MNYRAYSKEQLIQAVEKHFISLVCIHFCCVMDFHSSVHFGWCKCITNFFFVGLLLKIATRRVSGNCRLSSCCKTLEAIYTPRYWLGGKKDLLSEINQELINDMLYNSFMSLNFQLLLICTCFWHCEEVLIVAAILLRGMTCTSNCNSMLTVVSW